MGCWTHRRSKLVAARQSQRYSPPDIDSELPVAVHCKSGYRSIIAASLLQRAGFRNVINVAGGFDAWQQAGLPTLSAATGCWSDSWPVEKVFLQEHSYVRSCTYKSRYDNELTKVTLW